MWQDIKSTLHKLLDSCVPSKMSSTRYSQPWITREVKRLSRQEKRQYVKARTTKKARDHKRYEKLKQQTSEACKTAYNDYIINIISPDAQSNPKRFWGFINKWSNI